MSKLEFIEAGFSDHSVSDSDESDKMLSSEFHHNEDSIAADSTNDDVASQSMSDRQSQPITTVSDSNGIDISAKKKKKRKKKKKSTSAAILPVSDLTDVDNSSKSPIKTQSKEPTGWLSAFLLKKRTLDISPPPDIALSNDTYLQEFNQNFVRAADVSPADSEYSDSSDEQSSEIVGSGDQSDSPETAAEQEEQLPEEEAAPAATKICFFNLPYAVSAEEVELFASRLLRPAGCSVRAVALGFDKKRNLPSGSATAELFPLDADVNECIKLLQGENCGGRPVRVQKATTDRRRQSGGKDGARYFAADISFKCQSCGQVGHRQAECVNEALPVPCHLCAGRDHEAGSCPNITCYRCGLFGHHSRDCRNPPMSRPVICTQCGSSTHDIRQCRETEGSRSSSRFESRVEGRWIRCVSCNQFGHTMCQSLPKLSHFNSGSYQDVYCPNCGEKGHHIDFVASALTSDFAARGDGRGSGGCRAPKHEAYVKFPQLLADIDRMPHDKNNYYRDLLRYSYNSHSDQLLFPSLCRDSGGGGGGWGSSSQQHQPQRNSFREVASSGGSARNGDRRDSFGDERSRRRSSLNISSVSSDSEDDSARRHSTGSSGSKNKKNYCAPNTHESGRKRGRDEVESSGGSGGKRNKPSSSSRDDFQRQDAVCDGFQNDVASKADFDRKVEARRKRFGDVSR